MPDMAELKAALESILFVADQPVELVHLRRVLDVPLEAVEDLLAILVEDYKERGIRIARLKDTVRMVTAPDSASYVQAFLGLEQTVRLSSAALETLAIIAFKQPVTRAQVEAIRGVNSDGVIATLEGRGLIEETGQHDSPGHPFLYGTTMSFLQHFGLESLDELRRHEPQAPPASRGGEPASGAE
jgi:segregation and condensation protein B